MPSLVDIFNPSFFMILGILVLVAALLVVYFESKMREQNHKMTTMLNLITCMADEMNTIKINLNNPTSMDKINPSTLETNTHFVKHELIQVSDDDSDSNSDSNSDNDSDSKSDNDSNSDLESESSDSESNSEEIEDVIEIGEHNDIKVLKLNLPSLNEIDEDKNNLEDLNELDDLEDLNELDDLNDLEEVDDIASIDINEEQNNNEKINISDLNLKTINISNLEEVKTSDNIDYKKFTLNKLRSIVVEKELVDDSSKLKKNELLKLLGVAE
jgi:hypothetical protein